MPLFELDARFTRKELLRPDVKTVSAITGPAGCMRSLYSGLSFMRKPQRPAVPIPICVRLNQ